MRDILAALLRSRGYTHDDAADPYDLHWYGPTLGVRPLLVCVAYEISCEGEPHSVPGWDTYEVSIAHKPRGQFENAKADAARIAHEDAVVNSMWVGES